MSVSDISADSTHDLWVEARQFKLDISRPTPTTIELKITRPISSTVIDGAVITINERSISSSNYPVDGRQYVASLDLAAPADRITGLDGAHVVAFYSEILGQPLPAGVQDLTAGTTSFTITIANTVATQLYFASIHPSTNILQYYPIGIQSYPLEGSRIEKASETYSGNIPALPEAPLAPTAGMVYFDKQLGMVQYYTGSYWIPSRTDAILTGPVHPGVAGQVFMSGGSQLKVFDGIKWVVATPANMSFRVTLPAPTFVPMGEVKALTRLPTNPAVGDFVYDYTVARAVYWDGFAWTFPNSSTTLFNTGVGIIPAFVIPMTLEPVDLPAPSLGQLFYNTTTKTLDVWNGSTWTQANTDQSGTPTTDKMSIGTDGSYDERIRLIKVLKAQLGWPQNCVELQEEQFNIAIDNALDNYRQLSDGAYRLQYVMFPLIADQQLYYLNSAQDKTDRIVSVAKVHRLNLLGIQTANGSDAIWSSGILTSYYSAATVDILSLHLLTSLSEEFNRIFAGDLTFLWDEASRELLITRKIRNAEKVILECQMERTEQEILLDRWCKQYIQNWALAECKMQLGLLRSKFSSGTPGAAGSITLNGELLVSEARQDMTELKQELLDYEYGGHVGQGNVSFLIG